MAFRTNKTPVLQNKSASGAIASFDTILTKPLEECTSLITGYQEGSGTPSPSNVRNLVSFSSGTLNQTGKNLFNPTSIIKGTYDKTTETWSGLSGTQIAAFDFDFKPNTQYVFSGISIQSTANANCHLRISYTDGTGENIFETNSIEPLSFIKASNPNKSIASVKYAYGTGYSNSVSIQNFKIELGQQATAYEPYNGNTYTFTFGQNIYQGSIDWKRGVVVGTHSIVDLGSLTWLYNTQYANPIFYTNLVDAKLLNTYEKGDTLAEIFETYSVRDMNKAGVDYAVSISEPHFFSAYNLYIVDSDYTDPTAFKTAMNGVYLAYELANPITIPLGGVNLITQQGQNNIFCDAGDTSVVYNDLDIAKRGSFREVFKLEASGF